ncbi:MAG: hypothetical protein ACOY3E_09805 [Pseudomonadota bacterium]
MVGITELLVVIFLFIFMIGVPVTIAAFLGRKFDTGHRISFVLIAFFGSWLGLTVAVIASRVWRDEKRASR